MAKLRNATTLYVGNLYDHLGCDTARHNVTDRPQVFLYNRRTDPRAVFKVRPAPGPTPERV